MASGLLDNAAEERSSAFKLNFEFCERMVALKRIFNNVVRGAFGCKTKFIELYLKTKFR
jgi:hypothetical protein